MMMMLVVNFDGIDFLRVTVSPGGLNERLFSPQIEFNLCMVLTCMDIQCHAQNASLDRRVVKAYIADTFPARSQSCKKP